MKLWNKDSTTLSESIEKFTVGNDKIFDVQLAKHDVIGSIAHAKMLHNIEILNNEEITAVENALNQILQTIEPGQTCEYLENKFYCANTKAPFIYNFAKKLKIR